MRTLKCWHKNKSATCYVPYNKIKYIQNETEEQQPEGREFTLVILDTVNCETLITAGTLDVVNSLLAKE